MTPSGAWLFGAFGRHPALAGVTLAYVAAWTAYGIAEDTGQAYTYLAWMVCAVGLVMYVDGRVRFSTHVLALLSIVGFCHMAGGNLYFGGSVLYGQTWFGYLRYDHLVHFFGLGAAGLAVWEATRRLLSADGGARAALVVILGASTTGTVIEMGEYLGSLVLPSVRGGGYANNMQDLIANLLGPWSLPGGPSLPAVGVPLPDSGRPPGKSYVRTVIRHAQLAGGVPLCGPPPRRTTAGMLSSVAL